MPDATPIAASPKRRWYQYSLRTLLIFMTVAGCGLGWLGIKVKQEWEQKESLEAVVHTPGEFHSLLQTESFILHIDVDWAVQAMRSRPVVLRFQRAIQQDMRLDDVVIRRIDCSEQSGELWDTLTNWFRTQGADRSVMVTGYGAMVWVKSGKVVDSIHYAAEVGVEQLVARTHKAFATQ